MSIAVYEGQNIKYFGYFMVLNREIHQKVLIYVYRQFKSEFKENIFGFDIPESPFK